MPSLSSFPIPSIHTTFHATRYAPRSSGRSYFTRKIFMMGGNKNGADAERTIKGGNIKGKDKRENELTKLKVYGLDAFQVRAEEEMKEMHRKKVREP